VTARRDKETAVTDEKQEYINIYRIARMTMALLGEQVASLAFDPSKTTPEFVEEIVDALTLRFNTPSLAKTGALYPDTLYDEKTRDYWVLVEEHSGQGAFVPDFSE
jgi:hypothetical protein